MYLNFTHCYLFVLFLSGYRHSFPCLLTDISQTRAMPTLQDVEVEVVGVAKGPPKQGDLKDDDEESEETASQTSENEGSHSTEVVQAPTGPFDPTIYIDLTGRNICRAIYPVSFKSQKKRVKLVCGRTNCQFHHNSTDRAKGRFFIRQPKGGVDHGRADLPSLSKKEFEIEYDKFATRFEKDVAAQGAEEEIVFESDTDKETTTPAATNSPFLQEAADAIRLESNVDKGTTNPAATKRPPPSPEETTPATTKPPPPSPYQKSAHIDLGATTYHRNTTAPTHQTDTLPPYPARPIYGLQSRTGERKLTWDADWACSLQEEGEWSLAGMWKSYLKANAWLEEAQKQEETYPPGPKRSPRGEREGEKAPPVAFIAQHSGEPVLASKKKKAAKNTGKKSLQEAHNSDPSSSSSSASSSSSSHASSEDSDYSSTSEDSSTSSSEATRRRSRRKKSKKSKKTRKARTDRKGKKHGKRGRKKSHKGPVLLGRASSDPSTGTEDKVHGRHLTDVKLDRRLCPKDMPAKDREEFADLLLDIPHLPGMYSSGSDAGELTEVIGELKGVGDAIISANKHRKTKTQLNTQWGNERRTALLKVTTEESLLDMIDRINSGEKPAFKKQTYAIYSFMRRCMYGEEEIKEYLRGGLWPRIIEDTFKWNMEFLEQVRRIATKHKMWGGLAQEMIKHHGRKLADIRNYAVDYRVYLLEVYVYFREGKKDKFQNASIQEALWRTPRHQEKGQGEDSGENLQGNSRNSGCAHCKSKALHEIMGVGLGQSNCPLKGVSRTQARQMVGDILGHFKKNPSCDKEEYVKKKVEANKD